MPRKKFPALKVGDLPIERCPFFSYKDEQAIALFAPLWEILKGTKDVSLSLKAHSDLHKGFGEIVLRFGYSEEQKQHYFLLSESLVAKTVELGFFPVVLEIEGQLRLQIWPNKRAVETGKEWAEGLRRGGKESRWDD